MKSWTSNRYYGLFRVCEQESDDSKPSSWTAWCGTAPDFPEIGYVELAPNSIAHHMAPVYREALAVVASARGLTPVAPKPNETFNDWRERASV